MTKKYKLINDLNLRTTIEIEGKRIGIRFTGGLMASSGRVSTFGSFSTSDPKIQQALESDSGYGKSFICVTQAVDLNIDSPPVDEYAEFEKVSGVTNTQMAIEWLELNKKHEFGEVRKKADVQAVANNLKVHFIDWR